MFFEIGFHGIHQQGKRGLFSQPTRLPEGQQPLHPAVTLLALGAVRALAPQHGEPQRPLGPVIRRLYAGLIQKNPKAIDLPQYLAGQPAGVILCGLKEQKLKSEA